MVAVTQNWHYSCTLIFRGGFAYGMKNELSDLSKRLLAQHLRRKLMGRGVAPQVVANLSDEQLLNSYGQAHETQLAAFKAKIERRRKSQSQQQVVVLL